MKVGEIIHQQLIEIVGNENVRVNEILANHLYTGLGGEADYFLTPHTYEQVQAIVKLVRSEDLTLTLLGNGSNLIIRDGGIRGIVLNLKQLKDISIDDNKLVAQSGGRIIDASRKAHDYGLSGLEFSCGIPGTVGGALFMNAGAYGGEIKDCLESTLVVTTSGELKRLGAEELDLSYRTSNIPDKGHIVLEATFSLEKRKQADIKAVMDDLTARREAKQPLEYPSCGSVFKRPPGYFAGKLIQDSKLQGVSIGGAEVSRKHAGFIINKNQATAHDYISLIKHVQDVVMETYGVLLEREVKIIGEKE